MNLRAIRIETPGQVRQFASELTHLVYQGLKTWGNKAATLEQAKLAVDMMGDSVQSPRVVLMTLLTPGMHWEGYLYGLADLEGAAMVLQSWYVKEAWLPKGFHALFDLLETYCAMADLGAMRFMARAPVRPDNPRWRLYVERYKPQMLFIADLTQAEPVPAEEEAQNEDIPAGDNGGVEPDTVEGDAGPEGEGKGRPRCRVVTGPQL